jgi:hypothetical protein
MANVLVTLVRPLILNGAVIPTGAYATAIDPNLAASLVWRGDATYTNGAPSEPVTVSDAIFINSTNIADASTQGKAIMVAATLDAFLTAIGASLGASGSGGTGLKAICVPNADT